mmetsp:Transcript_9799/g.20398  ORF Transcript_9799/g.20398 Transcript_9799/m.20398 type:complete len:226 (-) Transcript_9799:681-1358(-)
MPPVSPTGALLGLVKLVQGVVLLHDQLGLHLARGVGGHAHQNEDARAGKPAERLQPCHRLDGGGRGGEHAEEARAEDGEAAEGGGDVLGGGAPRAHRRDARPLPLQLVRHVIRVELQEGVEVVEEADEADVDGQVGGPPRVQRLGHAPHRLGAGEVGQPRGERQQRRRENNGHHTRRVHLEGEIALGVEPAGLVPRGVVDGDLTLSLLHIDDAHGDEHKRHEEES